MEARQMTRRLTTVHGPASRVRHTVKYTYTSYGETMEDFTRREGLFCDF